MCAITAIILVDRWWKAMMGVMVRCVNVSLMYVCWCIFRIKLALAHLQTRQIYRQKSMENIAISGSYCLLLFCFALARPNPYPSVWNLVFFLEIQIGTKIRLKIVEPFQPPEWLIWCIYWPQLRSLYVGGIFKVAAQAVSHFCVLFC